MGNKAQLADILTYHVLGSEVKSTDLKPFQSVPTVEGKNLHVFAFGGKVKVGPSSKDLKNVVAADNAASNGVVHIIDGVMLPPSKLSASTPNIVELAQSVDDLSTLVTAVAAADLADTLSSPGPFTVFAPTNEGFGALPEGTLASLMKPENKTLHILKRRSGVHVGPDLQSLKKVVGADNLASNGVAHIIDGVMLPPANF